MKVITLDFETSLRQPWTETDSNGKPTFAPLPLHRIEIACWIVAEHGALVLKTYDCLAGKGNSLYNLCADMESCDRCVTWNGRGFDLPLLSLHALELGIDFGWYESRRHRFPNYKTPLWHYDMQEQLGDYGAARGLSLDRVAALLGLSKQGMHGSEVFDALKGGHRDQVLAYCANDALITYLIYLRWSATHGKATKAADAYEAAKRWATEHAVLGQFYGRG